MNSRAEKEDILKELFNISVGKAASMLSEIVNKKIILNVPNLEIIDILKDHLNIDDYFPLILPGNIMVSSIKFRDELHGKASLLFPANKMRKFINLCLSENNENQNFTDIDFDILKEIGNIILNSIIGELSNFLKIKLDYTLPDVKVLNKEKLELCLKDNRYSNILVLYISFKINNSEIVGAIIINLTLDSLNQLLNKVSIIEDDFYG